MASFCGVRCFSFGIFSGSVRTQFLEFGIWRVLLTLLFCLQCAFTKCLDRDITVATYPQGDINIKYPGYPLEIYCSAEDNYTSRDLKFLLSNNKLPSQIVNETTIKLYVEQPEIQRNVYYCHNKATKKNCVNRVLVDTPPKDVRDFECISYNLDALNCTWKSPKTLTDIKYNLSFAVNGKLLKPCTVERIYDTNYCLWNGISVPRYRQLLEQYEFNLLSYNIFGQNEQNITVDHFAVVKPDAPINLNVTSIKPHSVVLEWKIPSNIHDFLSCGVDHRIEYQIAKIDNLTTFHHVNSDALPLKNATYKFELSPLPFSYRRYEVRVYIKSHNALDKFWSDFSFVVFDTASELPPRPPGMPAGAFEISVFSHRIVRVYWQQLEEFEESGANFTYQVNVAQDNKTQTLFPDKNKSLSYVEIPKASLNALEISVKSFNNLGSSENSSHLYIPQEGQILAGPSLFSKFAYENGTYELSWESDLKYIDNYTLFWCQHNWTNVCVGRMNYTTLKPNIKNHIIHLPRDTQYQFAISMNKGIQTSGMVWATCEISRDGVVMHAFSASLSHGIPSKSFVELTWRMNCKLRDGIITGYNITYCPIIETSNVCDPEVGYHSVYIPNPKAMSANITNLLPCRTYNFYFGLNTTYGPKTINATTSVTTPEDTPTSPINVAISNITYNSMIISWDPPIKKNGNIKKYEIYNNALPYVTYTLNSPTLVDVSRKHFKLTNLNGYTNYTWKVQACNSLCSELRDSEPLFVRTTIGPPSKMNQPSISHNPDILKWERPNVNAGFLDVYQYRRVKDNNTDDAEIVNTTDLFEHLTYCDGDHDVEEYQVRAVNIDKLPYHGALAFSTNVSLPPWKEGDPTIEYASEWSNSTSMYCKPTQTLYVTLLLLGLFALVISIGCGSIKLYKKFHIMKDIKPVFPPGLKIEEEDTKYSLGPWNPGSKDDKTVSSDEALLLPNRYPVLLPEIKQKDDVGANSDHTDSTTLSDSSRGHVERELSTSDESSESSLRSDVDGGKSDKSDNQDQEDNTSTEVENTPENSPYFNSDKSRKPVVNPVTGYVTAPVPQPANTSYVCAQPTSSSYVMAGPAPAPSIFTVGLPQVAPNRPTVSSSGYVLTENQQPKSFMNFPMLGASPTKQFDSENIVLPPVSKLESDTGFIQLQSLDGVPVSKLASTVKPPPTTSSSGYIGLGDAVIQKHLSILSGGQLVDEPAILDPAISPDAYCRFSWKEDSTKDNLNTILRNSTVDSTNN